MWMSPCDTARARVSLDVYMPKHPPSMPPSQPAIDTTSLRASSGGTAKFAERFRDQFVDDFYSSTSTGLTVSSIGIGTYLGDSTDEDDALYESAIARAVRSGV